MKASFVFEIAKINIEPLTNTLPFLLAIWTLFWTRELIQNDNDDKSYVVTLSIMEYKPRCQRDRQAMFATIFPSFSALLVTPFSGLPFPLLYDTSTFKQVSLKTN